MKPFLRLALACLLLASLPASAQKTLPNPLRNILSLSDLHFNPFYDTALLKQLITSDYTAWEGIFQSSQKAPNSYGSDVNYPLLRSAFQAMKQELPNPAFVVISGDFLCHDFQDTYNSYAPNYPDSLQSFTFKTIRFVALMFDRQYPKTPVLPVLGNNDSDCGDYKLTPGGPFLSVFARAWVGLQRNGSATADSSFVKQFARGGYYTHPIPGDAKGEIILANTVFFSSGYANSCGNPAATPGAEEMKWLDSVLSKGKASWLVYHIPPGINVHSTVNGYGSCDAKIRLMWSATFNDQFLTMIKKYSGQIKAMLAGHTHMDDFRVIYKNGVAASFIHITPAISPLFGNNPGFQRISWNSVTLGLQNAETFYLNVAKPGAWTAEYNFQKTYNVIGINAMTLARVRQEILTDTVYRNRYINLYKVSNPGSNEINQQNWKAFWCGTGALTQQDYSDCWCK